MLFEHDPINSSPHRRYAHLNHVPQISKIFQLLTSKIQLVRNSVSFCSSEKQNPLNFINKFNWFFFSWQENISTNLRNNAFDFSYLSLTEYTCLSMCDDSFHLHETSPMWFVIIFTFYSSKCICFRFVFIYPIIRTVYPHNSLHNST